MQNIPVLPRNQPPFVIEDGELWLVVGVYPETGELRICRVTHIDPAESAARTASGLVYRVTPWVNLPIMANLPRISWIDASA